jgi:hypothetical protein
VVSCNLDIDIYKLSYSEHAENFFQYFLDSVAYIMNSNTYLIRYGLSWSYGS